MCMNILAYDVEQMALKFIYVSQLSTELYMLCEIEVYLL